MGCHKKLDYSVTSSYVRQALLRLVPMVPMVGFLRSSQKNKLTEDLNVNFS